MDTNQFQRIAKALADPRRFEIFGKITGSGKEMCCGDVVECFSVAQPTVSHHLKELTDAGLIETRSEGQFKFLRARIDVLAEYLSEVERRLNLPAAKERTRAKSAGRQKSAKA
ncbi:MAG: ArsR/SmtB family transcription factor [Pyrinomonadaceae bacterium]